MEDKDTLPHKIFISCGQPVATFDGFFVAEVAVPSLLMILLVVLVLVLGVRSGAVVEIGRIMC